MSVSLSALHIRRIVLDIEGTTTPADFVYQVLFPYARTHVQDYLAREWSTRACRSAVALLNRERAAETAGTDRRESQRSRPADVVAYVHRLMDDDRKSSGLKALQGLIWQEGYRRGDLRGSVYPDVPHALERWNAQGRNVYIYSSGSVLAQQLLFGATDAGDLTRLLNGYFDTAVGPKLAVDSYRLILDRLGAMPQEVLFVSDVPGELDASKASGMYTALCVRGAMPANPGPHPIIRDFDEILD